MALMVMGGRKACILGNVKRHVLQPGPGMPEVQVPTTLQICEILWQTVVSPDSEGTAAHGVQKEYTRGAVSVRPRE